MLRWGVIGTGNMARLFLDDSQAIANGKFVSVYSANEDRAKEFASNHQLESHFSDLSAFLANPEIDAVYIASTHPNHAPQAIQALNAGKHVLVEKPMSLTHAHAQEVFDAAKANSVLCCEALWTKFSGAYQSVAQQVSEGRLGELKHIHANFGFAIDLSATEQRLLNPEHAGGALLDIGLYPIFLVMELMGVPDDIQANVVLGDTGVDLATDLIFKYNNQTSATISYRFDAMMPTKATLSGTKGWAELESPFFASNATHWNVNGQPTTVEHTPLINRGWGEEFRGVNSAIASGALEAREHTWEDSLKLAKLLERIRSTWGPTYPFE